MHLTVRLQESSQSPLKMETSDQWPSTPTHYRVLSRTMTPTTRSSWQYLKCCRHLNSELGAQTALHLSVSKGVIQRKRESWSSATSSSNDNSRPGPMAQAVHTGMKYVLFT